MWMTSVMFAGISLGADDPTLHQVYQAVEAGQLNDAQGMMNKVLRDHPNSGKAHFVEAELLAKEGYLANAAAELSAAERLAPGLPFADPRAVKNLRQRIAYSHRSTRLAPSTPSTQFVSAGAIPMGLLLAVSALITGIIFIVRRTSQRNASAFSPTDGSRHGTGFGSGAPLQPPGAGSGMPPMGSAGGGIGSGILGGIATGAALGAGMVAGEALMHRFTDGGRSDTSQTYIPASSNWDSIPSNMGGADFGVSDSSSWDGNSSGGDEWS